MQLSGELEPAELAQGILMARAKRPPRAWPLRQAWALLLLGTLAWTALAVVWPRANYPANLIVRVVIVLLLLVIYAGRRAAGQQTPARVPPRFGLGSILVMLTCYGALFAGLRLLDAEPVWHLVLGLFLFLEGLAQWRLKNPTWARAVSVAVGMAYYLAGIALVELMQPLPQVRRAIHSVFLEGLALAGVIGYVGGGAVAAIFLVMNQIDEVWKARGERSAAAMGPTRLTGETPTPAT